jgi:hypothetical protein
VTSRTVARTAVDRRRRPAARLGVVLGVLALVLRLAWPMPPALVSGDPDGWAALAEHALCLAAPASTDPAPQSRDNLPASPDDRADHDHSLCCLWHASAGFVVPQIGAPARIAFVETVPPFAAAAQFHPASLTGPSRARGPPAEA